MMDTIIWGDKKSIINDPAILANIKNTCYSDDIRAVWIGPGYPITENSQYNPWCNWIIQHHIMYYGFFENIMTPKNILDIGCGSGYSTICISDKYTECHIDAIDMDHICLNFAKKYNKNADIEYHLIDFLLYETDKLYDYIFMLEIYEHLPYHIQFMFLDKALSLLTPNGKLFFTTPNALTEQCGGHHIGLLGSAQFPSFIERYHKNIIHSEFYDNRKLSIETYHECIIKEPYTTYDKCIINCNGSALDKSHFKIIMIKI